MTIEYWNAVVDLNLNGVFICAKAVSPTMARKQFGRTIRISSRVPWKGNADIVACRAAKGGVYSFTGALASAVADDGITAHVIAPEPIVTEAQQREGMTDMGIAHQAAGLPLKRFGLVEEVAPTAMLLATQPDGDFYTRVTLHVSRGDVTL